MQKFMVLYQLPVAAGDQMAIANSDRLAGASEWSKWQERVGDALIDLGAPLMAGKHIVFGAASESASLVMGYSIIQAKTLDEAVKLLEDHPHFKPNGSSSIEVLEFVPAPGWEPTNR